MRSIWMNRLVMGVVGLGVTAGASVTGCGDVLSFPVDASGEAEIAGDPLGGLLAPLNFAGFGAFDISQTQDFENQGVTKDDVESVVISSLSLEVVSPTGEDLSFIDSMDFYVEADGLDRIRVAHQDSFPEGSSRVDFVLDDAELVEYVTADTMSVTTETSATVPEEDTTVKVDITFEVKATPAGACGAIQEAVE